MGLFFRKKIKLFKNLNLNLTKGGFGLSFGLKGLRTSTNKNGTTINAGRNGLYFRKKLSNKAEENQPGTVEPVKYEQIEQSENNFNNKFFICFALMAFSLVLTYINIIFIFVFAASIFFLIKLQLNKRKIIDSDKQARIERQRQSKYQEYNYSYQKMENKKDVE